MFGEHYSKEYAIDIDQLEYTLNRFKDTYSDDILFCLAERKAMRI